MSCNKDYHHGIHDGIYDDYYRAFDDYYRAFDDYYRGFDDYYRGFDDYYRGFDDYYRGFDDYYKPDSRKKAKYTPSTSSSSSTASSSTASSSTASSSTASSSTASSSTASSSSSSTASSPTSNTRQPMTEGSISTFLWIFTIVYLLKIIWTKTPTAESLYQRAPSAEALAIFAACTLGGLFCLLVATAAITVIAYMFVSFTEALQDVVKNIRAIRRRMMHL